MNRDTLRQTVNALSVLIALTVNFLANALPLNGQNTGEISDRFQVYFVPAGYVFSIWSVIFIGWIAFALYQFRATQKESPRLRRLGYLFALSGIFNALWLFCWHYNAFGWSVLVMLTLLGLLIASYLRLDVGRVAVKPAGKWFVDVPFSVYLGWITVATVANVSSFLYFNQLERVRNRSAGLGGHHAGCGLSHRSTHDPPPQRQRLRLCARLGFRGHCRQTVRRAVGGKYRLGRVRVNAGAGVVQHRPETAGLKPKDL